MEDEEKKELIPPEDIGKQIASVLLGEIEQGGVVDSTHQVCVLNPGTFTILSTIFFFIWPSLFFLPF